MYLGVLLNVPRGTFRPVHQDRLGFEGRHLTLSHHGHNRKRDWTRPRPIHLSSTISGDHEYVTFSSGVGGVEKLWSGEGGCHLDIFVNLRFRTWSPSMKTWLVRPWLEWTPGLHDQFCKRGLVSGKHLYLSPKESADHEYTTFRWRIGGVVKMWPEQGGCILLVL